MPAAILSLSFLLPTSVLLLSLHPHFLFHFWSEHEQAGKGMLRGQNRHGGESLQAECLFIPVSLVFYPAGIRQ